MGFLDSMKRRSVLQLLTGAVAQKAIGSSPLGTQSGAVLSPTHLSRLFDISEDRSLLRTVQDVLITNDNLICLYHENSTRRFAIVATDAKGTTLWEHALPDGGSYLTLGTADFGAMILIHALQYPRDASKKSYYQNRIVKLDPLTGAVTIVGSLSSAGSVRFAGDSLLVSVGGEPARIWRLQGLDLQSTVIPSLSAEPEHVLFDMITPDLLSILRRDGTSMSTVSVPTVTINEFNLASPVIATARAKYDSFFSRQGVNSAKSFPSVLPACGPDGAGHLLALVSPFEQNIATVVAIDQAGAVSTAGALQLPPRTRDAFGNTRKLATIGLELAVVYADGSVAWYSAAQQQS